jgi:hypothetical protein
MSTVSIAGNSDVVKHHCPLISTGVASTGTYCTIVHYSCDGLIGREAGELLKRLSLRLADKWERPYSVVRGFVSARMSVAIVRATHLCLRGSRVPLSQISRRPQWEDRAGLGLFKTDY